VTATGHGVGTDNGNRYTIEVPCTVQASYLVKPVPPNAVKVSILQGPSETAVPAC